MKILITGGAGFIGSNLADRLVQRGDSVLVIDNFNTGRRDNLKTDEQLEIVEGTIANETLVEDYFRRFRPDIVVHAAASYKNPDDWHEDVITNVLGTSIIVKACQQFNISRLIYFQTALCYGLKPIEQPITLKHPIRPQGSSYALSKTAGEQYIELSGVEFVSFRLANAYGPRNISGPLPTFYNRLTTGKKCFVMDTRRDFIYVQDLIDCVMKAIDGNGKSGAYHISSGKDFAIKELFEETVEALNIKFEQEIDVRERNPDDAFTILLDPSVTNKDFEWEVKTNLKDGVKDTIDYYKKYGISETYTHLKLEQNIE